MKGQATIEFLASMLLFLLTLLGALTVMSGNVPDFQDDMAQSSKNMEMFSTTEGILGSPGYHNNGTGGTDWENNIESTQDFGLASEYLVLDKEKLDAISTTGKNKFNYSQFREISELEHQYYFDFTWYPIIETSNSFIRTEPPSYINETDELIYNMAENRVHYGTFNIYGENWKFLVTAHNGVYNTTYISPDWEFRDDSPKGIGDYRIIENVNFTIVNFQNRQRKPGTSVVLKHRLKGFGANPQEVEQQKTKLNRYAALKASGTDTEPVRIEVLAW